MEAMKVILLFAIFLMLTAVGLQIKDINETIKKQDTKQFGLNASGMFGFNENENVWNRIRVDKEGHLIVKIEKEEVK